MKKLLFLLCLSVCSLCQAGTGYYVTFVNDTDGTLSLEFAHADGWYPDDFAKPHTILAHQKLELYTENKAKGAGVAGVRVYSGQYQGSQVEVWQSIKGGLTPPYTSTQSISWTESEFIPSWQTGTILQYHVGTNNPDIITHIKATDQGVFNTVYATVIFPRFAAAASCENFRVVGNTASGYCYNSGKVIRREYREINTETCRARYGDRFNIDNLNGLLTCTPPKPPIRKAGS
ncbi:MAG: hypothetical protein KGJ64_00225 [Betaproteobacteria bacterium]|nr:hypothetical protein [Betaproteobacteria bacterium]